VFRPFVICNVLHQQPIPNDARLWKVEGIKRAFLYSTAVIFQAMKKSDVGSRVNVTSVNVQKYKCLERTTLEDLVM